jgi:CHAT domain-containing protein
MDAHRPCPDSALLAAFLDGTLADYERAAVVSHLVECPQCRAIALTVVEFQEVEALDALWERGDAAPPPSEPLFAHRATRWTWAKTRAPSAAAAVAALILAALGAIAYVSTLRSQPTASPQQAVSVLLDAAATHRPLEARLAGVTAYAPSPSRTVPSTVSDRARVQLTNTAAGIRDVYEHDDGAWSRRALGMAALLSGELNDAIATLEVAAAAAPNDAAIVSDLAAAYYERARLANRPDDLPAALSAVERVLANEPANREALFNRALVVTALGLRPAARQAWQTYIAHDPSSPWTVEARERLADIAVVPRGTWQALKVSLDAGNRAGDADEAVRSHASAAREFIHSELVKRWVAAARSRDERAEATTLTRLRTLADAFARVTGDRLYQDFLLSITQSTDAIARRRLVRAHEQYLTALTLMGQQQFVQAAPILERVHRELAALHSPFSLRAQIELAAVHYYELRHKEAADILAEVKAVASERRYGILVTRAAWLEGMSAFASNDFAAATAAYEEMLVSAGTAGDLDQWVMAHVLLGNLHDTLGNAQLAWQHRVEAAERLDEVHAESIRALFLISAAGDASVEKHYDAALLFQSALLASTLPPSLEVQARAQRALAWFALRRPADAREELERAKRRLRDVATTTSRLTVEADVLAAEGTIWAGVDRNRARTAVDRLLTLPLLTRDHVRRARAHLQRAQIAQTEGDLAGAEESVRRGFAALDLLHGNPAAEFVVRATDPVWQLYAVAAQLSLARGDLARAFAYTERGRMRTRQERQAWSGRVPSLGDVQRVLKPDSAVMILTQFDLELNVWVIRGDQIATHVLPVASPRAATLISAQLQEMVRGAPAPRASAELFDTILRPVLGSIGDAANLIVVADAPYNRIAFAGLWDRHRNRYVVEDRRVVLAPSATAYLISQGGTPARTAPALRQASIVAGPQENSGDTAALAQSLSVIYPQGRVVLNGQASAGRFVEEVTGRDIVHVAARVSANEELPGLSYVDLGGLDGRSYSSAAFARTVQSAEPLRAQLVTLALGVDAASSGRTDDTFGFARALLAAGVTNVVSPVAGVDARSLARTWREFHEHYAAGAPAAESLQRAQLAALIASDRRPGPWATLTVFGSAQ